MDWLAVQREHNVGERAAANPHQRARKADCESVKRHRHRAGQIGAEVPTIAREQKFYGDEAGDQHEGDLEDGRRCESGDHRAAADTDHGRKRPQPDDPRDDQALFAMGEVGTDGGRHNDGDRGADAKLHAHFLRHVQQAKYFVEHRHDHGAAANAEQPGQ